jgi:hypothetical protein
MSRMIFLAHLPLLRIAEEEIDFAGGSLWRMPFAVYDDLSLRKLADHEKAYTATAPDGCPIQATNREIVNDSPLGRLDQ